MIRILLLLFVGVAPRCFSQVHAKAISYQVDFDLFEFSPDYVADTDAEDLDCIFEVDLYYTNAVVKTISRKVKKPEDFDLSIRQRYYEIKSDDEFNIDNPRQYVLHKSNQHVKLHRTGRSKMILGYKCNEYSFIDYRGIQLNVWLTKDLSRNICPVGNYSLNGTALEVTASNGVHYVATDFAEGEVAADFFQLPESYERETIDLLHPTETLNK